MCKKAIWIVFVGAAMLASSWGVGTAVGRDEQGLEQQIGELRAQVKELIETGRDDEVEHFAQQLGQLHERLQRRLDQLRGDRPDRSEAEQRLEELTRHMAELEEHGQGEEAQRVARQIEAIRQRLERDARADREREDRLAGMKRRIAQLKETERYEEANRLAQEARQMMRGGPEIWQRIGHLREAAEHLHAAGLHDVANGLIRQAERMERAARPGREER